MRNTITLATRGSPLALKQSAIIAQYFIAAGYDCDIEFLTLTTAGDRNLHDHPSSFGGKGIFTKEPEEALLSGRAQIAVHSMKDMPAEDTQGLCIAAVSPREDARDMWIGDVPLTDLPKGAIVGTASLRRRAQILRLRPDLEIKNIRGNVDTRINKLKTGEYAATVLAAAGLNRLGKKNTGHFLDIEQHLPASCQGLIAVQTTCDSPWREVVANLIACPYANIAGRAERAFLHTLGASCSMAVAAHALHCGDNTFQMRGVVYAYNGADLMEFSIVESGDNLVQRAQLEAHKMLAQGAARYFTS